MAGAEMQRHTCTICRSQKYGCCMFTKAVDYDARAITYQVRCRACLPDDNAPIPTEDE